MNQLRTVTIRITGIITPDTYYAKSYPHYDMDNDGKVELYSVPVYKVFIEGTNDALKNVRYDWKALRFMPYLNDPLLVKKQGVNSYKTKGFVVSGLSKGLKKSIKIYNPNYRVHNTPSPFDGAFQIKDSFLIHAGPEKITDIGWGAAGCVEIIGNFTIFKENVKNLSGSKKPSLDSALKELVEANKLYVNVEYAEPPKLKGVEYQ